MRKGELVVLGIIILSFIVGIYFYPQMPERMATHWNAKGEVDGYMSRLWGSFILPLILLPVILLFLAIPRIDPLRANIEKFRKYYDGFIILFSIFMLALQLQVIFWNIGVKVSPNVILPIALGLLFYYLGILIENAKRNYFIGIRTPWTLNSDAVWDKTHKVGGKLFKIAAVVTLIGALFPDYAFLFILVPVLIVAVYTTIYSYLQYRREPG